MDHIFSLAMHMYSSRIDRSQCKNESNIRRRSNRVRSDLDIFEATTNLGGLFENYTMSAVLTFVADAEVENTPLFIFLKAIVIRVLGLLHFLDAGSIVRLPSR